MEMKMGIRRINSWSYRNSTFDAFVAEIANIEYGLMIIGKAILMDKEEALNLANEILCNDNLGKMRHKSKYEVNLTQDDRHLNTKLKFTSYEGKIMIKILQADGFENIACLKYTLHEATVLAETIRELYA